MKAGLVTLLCDKFYIGGLVSIYTLLKSTPDFNYPITILEWGELSNSNKNNLKSLYNNINFKKINISDYPQTAFDSEHRHWNYNCGFRFDIFTLENLDKLLFFDSDIVFQQNINELFNFDVLIGAVERPIARGIQYSGKQYFNGGLLLIDKSFLTYKTKSDLIKILSSDAPKDEFISSRKWVGNEPILNHYFKDKVTMLPKKYNFCIDECTADTLSKLYNLHFIGHSKPWIDNKFDSYINRALTTINTKPYANILEKKLLQFYRSKLDFIKRDFPHIVNERVCTFTNK